MKLSNPFKRLRESFQQMEKDFEETIAEVNKALEDGADLNEEKKTVTQEARADGTVVTTTVTTTVKRTTITKEKNHVVHPVRK